MNHLKLKIVFVFIASAITILSCTKNPKSIFSANSEWSSGGLQTVFDESSSAFSHGFSGLSARQESVHSVGDALFENTFVSAPSITHAGLGPAYNNVSCISCHIGDGRGKVPGVGEDAASILFRISMIGTDEFGGPIPVPGFGTQISNRIIAGYTKEADVTISFTEKEFAFTDGEKYNLRFPTYQIISPYKAMPGQVLLSPRVASPVFGLGLLEAIPASTIESFVAEQASSNKGISGKINYVYDITTKTNAIGRFGWKANQPTVLQQSASAFQGDIGITNYLYPTENTFGQSQMDNLNDDVEVSDSILHAVSFYIQTLAVPARRNVNDKMVMEGKALFAKANCNSCHKSDVRTVTNVALAGISNQLIHPFTDLLVHDMGADLADNRPDYLANGNEWRTAPLWGIGLTKRVNGHTNFLHDGRARNLMEAVLWHGGEAEESKNTVTKMNKAERLALIKYLESL
jgi:CxxC motif-containing protein (DUF1111 family)